MRLKADITLLFIAIIWGSAFAAQRIAGHLGSVYLFNGARYLLAGFVVLPFALRAGGQNVTQPGHRQQQWGWMGAAGFILFIAAALQQAGMLWTSAANAGFITSLYVVFVPIVLLLVWREKPNWLAIAAVMVAVLGAFLLSSAGKGLTLEPGDALELAGALAWTLHVILLGKVASKFEPMSFSVGQLIICGVLNLIVGLLVERPSSPDIMQLILPVLYTALLPLGLGYTLQVWAQRHTPPADAALILSLESVFAALSGWMVLREMLEPVQILGCVLIFGAVLLSQAKPRVSV